MQRLLQIIAKGRNLPVASSEKKKLKHLYRCSAALKDELTLVNTHLEKKRDCLKKLQMLVAMNVEQKIETIKNSIHELTQGVIRKFSTSTQE